MPASAIAVVGTHQFSLCKQQRESEPTGELTKNITPQSFSQMSRQQQQQQQQEQQQEQEQDQEQEQQQASNSFIFRSNLQ